MLGLDDIFMCIHDDVDNCKCRKPNPGMIFDAKSKWNIDLQKSFLIGDRWKDIQAGKNAGIGTFLLEHNYEEKKVEADYESKSFTQIIEQILKLNK